ARFAYAPTWPAENGPVTFNGSASCDANPNATLQFRWNWTNDGVWDTAWSSTPTAQHAYGIAGNFIAALEVNDSAGFLNATTRPVPVDGAPPVTVSHLDGLHGLNGWFIGNVTAWFTATDDRSGVAWRNYSLDGGAWQTYGGPFLVTGEGIHALRYFSVDNASNSEAHHTPNFKKDSLSPHTTPTFDGTVV